MKKKILKYDPSKTVALLTIAATAFSVVTVNALFYLLQGHVNMPVLLFTFIMPLLMAPPLLYLIVNMAAEAEHFKNAYAKEQASNQQKDQFLIEKERFILAGEMIANIAHQWRQPLNTINLTILSSKVKQSTSQLTDEDLSKAFDTIENNAHYLSNTIEDFRSFFQNKQSSKIVPFSTIINEINAITQLTLSKERIELDIDVSGFDAAHLFVSSSLSQPLLNVIINSKDALIDVYSDKKLILFKVKKTDAGISISACDNGAGIPAHVLPNIFDPYYSTKAEKHGSGLGLHMSRQIVEKMFGGTMVADQQKRQGACFTITLPYSEACYLES
jgi:signal transduction histidine kinase